MLETGRDAIGPRSRFAERGALRLHYVDARAGAPGPAALVVPGFGERAEDHIPLLDALAPRRALAVDLRSRGRSSYAESGYGLEDHAGDVGAIAEQAGLERVHLISYSRGTSYALAWAFAHPDQVVSITVGDYPAAQILPAEQYWSMMATRKVRGRPVSEVMPATAVAAMLAEAVDLELWDELAALDVPVLVVYGGARGAMVDERVLDRYRAVVRDLRVEAFPESGHDLWRPDPQRFSATVAAFLDELDSHAE
jgi:non-heme chloroperoxidase